MNVQQQDLESFPVPPPVIKTLINGFNIVANNIYLIVFPVIIDLFIWLFPGISIEKFSQPILQTFSELSADLPADGLDLITELLANFNMFTLLRTLPIGVASLFSASLIQENPINATPNFEISGFGQFLLIAFLINLIGILLGGIYYRQVADLSTKPIRPRFEKQLLRVLLLSGAWLLFFMIINIPIALLFVLVGLLGGFLQTLVSIVLMIPASWLLLIVYYSYYPLFLNDSGVITAVRKTLHIIRYSAPTLGWFSIIALLISQGLNLLWVSAPAVSWVSLVGIFGHAFISAGLLAASFIYFNKTSVWVDETLLWFSKNDRSKTDRIA